MTLIYKTTSRSLTALAVTAILLLIAADAFAIHQGDRKASERQSPEAARQAAELFQEAWLLSGQKDRTRARARLQEAMRLWVQVREPGKAAKAALQMGDRDKQARNYQDALYYYRQALEVKSLPNSAKSDALIAIARLCAELYQGALAGRYFNEAFNVARTINDLSAQTLALMGLANLYHQQGEYKQALNYIAQAQQLNRQKKADADPASFYLLGQIKQAAGLVQEAKSAFQDALEIYKQGGKIEGQIRVLCSLSSLSLLAAQKQTALEQAELAVKLANEQARLAGSHAGRISVRELQWPAYLSRARVERVLGQNERAIKSYALATHHIEGVWWTVYTATEARAIAFREETQAAYREYVDLLIGQGQFKKAYTRADEAKARTILTVTAARQATPPSADSNQAASRREQSQAIARLRLQLLDLNLSPEQQAKVQKNILDGEYDMQLQLETERSADPLVYPQPFTAEQLQQKMAKDHATLAEFSLGETRSFVWLFTRGEFFCEILPSRKEIEKEVKSYIDDLAAPPNHLYLENNLARLRKQAEQLFTTLFGGLAKHLEPGQRLIVVPDGLLHYLPFEALIHNGRYLVEDHEISYNASASMLNLWPDSASHVAGGDKLELFAVGDPIYELDATTSGGKRSKPALSNLARQMLAARGIRLSPLPGTRTEVKDIAALFPAGQSKVLLDKESTEEAIKREPLSRYRRLHFATHSLVDEKSPLHSAVVLTPGDGAEEDGVLEVSEISRLNLDSDLVVVSACQTGRGQLLSGEGIVGLSRAFIQAGARSVVVSLWNVSDVSTGQLMKSFYQHLTDGLSNVAALRKAKLQMLNSGKATRHPYYWSSFVMMGKP
jgi:CHAT domain-containing protein/tetratricopeptide (TPR) repeat protein